MMKFNCEHGKCQSPAECALMQAFDSIREEFPDDERTLVMWAHPSTELPLELEQQAMVGRWRCDFLLGFGDGKLAIEVDGFDYHSSKDQMERDRRRDRDLLLDGVPTIRFTGSEVMRDPVACMDEAVGCWMALHERDVDIFKRGKKSAEANTVQRNLPKIGK
jgi:very-short-patch-repair endonuclease